MTLSASLPPLKTDRNQIVIAETGQPIRLRGINRSGLEYSSPEDPGSLSKAGITPREFDQIASWGANIVRLPFNQQWALAAPGCDPEPYLSALDHAIELAAKRGMYTLLDLQWLNATQPHGTLKDGSFNFVPPLPNAASLELWPQLAARYRDEPAVLYDILNEPHDPLPDDPVAPHGIRPDRALYRLPKRRVSASEWHPWAIHLVNLIREQNSRALIFVSGLDWGYDLRHFPLTGIEDVVYSSHVYPTKKNWDRSFGKLSRTHPVFIAEWGGQESSLAWGEELLRYLDERGLGWTAWSWSDHPRLVEIASSFTPTPFGSLVRASLLDQAT